MPSGHTVIQSLRNFIKSYTATLFVHRQVQPSQDWRGGSPPWLRISVYPGSPTPYGLGHVAADNYLDPSSGPTLCSIQLFIHPALMRRIVSISVFQNWYSNLTSHQIIRFKRWESNNGWPSNHLKVKYWLICTKCKVYKFFSTFLFLNYSFYF